MTDVTHDFSSGKSDGTDATKVRPTNWNKAHVGALEILDRELSTDQVVSSTTEESVYSYAITAGKLGTTGGLRFRIGGDCLVNAAGTLILAIRFGPTATALLSRDQLFVSNAIDLQDTATRHAWWLDLLIMNSASNAQKAVIGFMMIAASGGFQIAALDTSQFGWGGAGFAEETEDSTAALTVDLTAKFSVSSASLSFRKEIALTEFIPPA